MVALKNTVETNASILAEDQYFFRYLWAKTVSKLRENKTQIKRIELKHKIFLRKGRGKTTNMDK